MSLPSDNKPGLYPLFADLAGRAVLVVGGGIVAERKADALLAAGAVVALSAPRLTPKLSRWVAAGRITRQGGVFKKAWLDGVWLVVAATNDRELNRRVAAAACAVHLWANVVDDASLSSFHVPAVIHRGPLAIAISSGGTVPALARHVREHIESLLDHSLGALGQLLARFRTPLKRRFPTMASRRRVYDELITGEVAALIRQGKPGEAQAALSRRVQKGSPPSSGRVALVGAGPGDPGLLTLAALRRLHEADVIVHDRLVSREVLALARRDALRIDAGKRPGSGLDRQAWINATLVNLALHGKRVVRLKGGDPFIFGRGGEELEYLRAHDVDYEVVPGITAAAACAAYAGVPLTHRDRAHSVHLVTAHQRGSLDTVDWPALARDRQTLAVYMGVAQLDRLRRQLLKHGGDPNTPFALIENGSTPAQRVVTGLLGNLPYLARQHAIQAPALLILGEVASLAERLAWFGTAPNSCQADIAA